MDPAFLSHLRQLWDPEEPDFLPDLLKTFIQDAARRIRAMRRALADGDAPGLARAAHSLKGASASIGARGVAQLCDQIVGFRDRPWTAQTGKLVRRVERAVDQVKAEVEGLDVRLLAP